MTALDIEPTYRVVLGETEFFRILLVGVGGTGSTLALFLAGLAYHTQQKGVQVELTLVDPDTINAANVGRQAFSPAEALSGDLPKASSLALRLNAAYGLDITAWPAPYEAEMGAHWLHQSGRGSACRYLIIGCVDTHTGRQEIANTVAAFQGRIWALDCGNERFNGQVLIGNTTDVDRIRLDPLGLCSDLPSPYLQEPDLLEPGVEVQPFSCAGMMPADKQSLMINRLAAAIAAQYVTDFVLHRQVKQMGTYFSVTPTVMTPRLITVANLRRYRQPDFDAPAP
jgi:PRTRC genetic system ThiF family protein